MSRASRIFGMVMGDTNGSAFCHCTCRIHFYQDFDVSDLHDACALPITFSAARSFALRERGLTAISSSDAVTGFRVNIVQYRLERAYPG
jgi:hypothetical protein